MHEKEDALWRRAHDVIYGVHQVDVWLPVAPLWLLKVFDFLCYRLIDVFILMFTSSLMSGLQSGFILYELQHSNTIKLLLLSFHIENYEQNNTLFYYITFLLPLVTSYSFFFCCNISYVVKDVVFLVKQNKKK